MRESKSPKRKKKPNQLNIRIPDYLVAIIEAGQKAAGLSQAEFIEKCVVASDEKVAAMSAEERAGHLETLRRLKQEAKAKKIGPA